MKKYELTTAEQAWFIVLHALMTFACWLHYGLANRTAAILAFLPIAIVLLWNFRIVGSVLYYAVMLPCMLVFSLLTAYYLNGDEYVPIVITLVLATLTALTFACAIFTTKLHVVHKNDDATKRKK